MAFWDSLLNWLGYGQEEDTLPADNQVKEPELLSTPANNRKGKLVSLPTARQSMRMIIARPQSFDQVANLAENLKNYRPVIVNVEALPVDEARRIIDFLSGATYALGGRVRRVTSGIFIFTSSNIDLGGDPEEHVPAGLNWLEVAARK